MKSIRKVIWAEGMFLGQQHFQLWDEYYERLQNLHVRSISPLSWGLLDFEYDEDALENNQFRLISCHAIFPDGRVISYNLNENHIVSIELNKGFSDKVDIYLCLPANRSASGINGYRENGKLCAWKADYLRIQDENDASREREVMLASPNLVLLTGDDSLENYSSLKISELVNDGEGVYKIVDDFVPTITRIGASNRLISLLQNIIDLFSAKIRILNERRNQLTAQSASFGHNDVSNFLVLQTLSSAIPLLNHYKNTSDIHPEKIYSLLVSVIGGLCPFGFDLDVHNIPKYKHNDLTVVFDRLERQLRKLVDIAMPGELITLDLKKEADLLYSLDIVDSKVISSSLLYIAVYSPSDNPLWINVFSKMVKVSSRQDIEVVVASALPGIKIQHVQRPPNNLPVKSGYEYFKIVPHGKFWDRVSKLKTLAIFLPNEFRDIKINILTIPLGS